MLHFDVKGFRSSGVEHWKNMDMLDFWVKGQNGCSSEEHFSEPRRISSKNGNSKIRSIVSVDSNRLGMATEKRTTIQTLVLSVSTTGDRLGISVMFTWCVFTAFLSGPGSKDALARFSHGFQGEDVQVLTGQPRGEVNSPSAVDLLP